MRSLPLIALTLSLACSLDATGVIPPEATRVDPDPREASAIDTTATGFVTTPPRYPIHVHWIRCEPAQADGYGLKNCHDADHTEEFGRGVVGAVQGAIDRWADVIAPTPPVSQIATADGCDNPHQVIRWWCRWEKGEVLPPGLHLLVSLGPEATMRSYASSVDGTEGFARWGLINIAVTSEWHPPGASEEVRAQIEKGRLEALYQLTLHEIGHVLGVGSGAHWFDNLQRLDDVSSVMTDPKAVAVFDRLGGDSWAGPKVLVRWSPGPIHWESCLMSQDIMAGWVWNRIDTTTGRIVSERSFITELSAASLRPGYRYDPAVLRPAEIRMPVEESFRQWCLDGPLRERG